jgi:hypothetical protein
MEMDVVALMERVTDTDDDIAFSIKFTKARERCPENRADFEPVTIALRGDEWLLGAAPKAEAKDKGPKGNNSIALDALTKALLKDGKTPPASNDIPAHTPCVSEQIWRDYVFNMLTGETKVKNQAVKRAVTWLCAHRYVGLWNGLVWKIDRKESK